MPPKKRPSTPSASPEGAQVARQRKKTGPPPFKPTAEQRRTVEFMAGAGIQEDRMVQLVINPGTGKPIDAKTLRKHFRQELDGGHTKADTLVAQSLFKNATTATKAFPGGIPLAQIFWLKTRARWKPPESGAPPEPNDAKPEQIDDKETTRRLAFLLAQGAASAGKKTKEPA